MMLHLKEVHLESARNCDVSSHMYCLKCTFKGPEYTRNIVFL